MVVKGEKMDKKIEEIRKEVENVLKRHLIPRQGRQYEVATEEICQLTGSQSKEG